LTFLLLAFFLSPVSAKNFEILTGEWVPYVSEKMKGDWGQSESAD